MFSFHFNSCLEFFTDLLAQLHTRRFLRTFLDDAHVLEQCTLSPLANGSAPVGGQGFQPLLEQFAFYLGFEIADHSGEALSESEVLSTHLQKVQERVGKGLRMEVKMIKHECEFECVDASAEMMIITASRNYE